MSIDRQTIKEKKNALAISSPLSAKIGTIRQTTESLKIKENKKKDYDKN